jgi:hypothetical protein
MLKWIKSLFAPSRRTDTPARVGLEELESRTLLNAGPRLLSATHTLRIGGTGGNDSVLLSESAGQLLVSFDGVAHSYASAYASADVSLVRFQGRTGNDTFINNTAISSAAVGGPGNDLLIGGSANDTLNGCAGDDTLVGGAGQNRLIGGGGSDDAGSSGDDTETGCESHDLVATLSGLSGASGQAVFTPGAADGQTNFVLGVVGLTANQTFDVQVDGTTIGQVNTDANGQGELTLSDPALAIVAGSVIQVVQSQTSVTLQAVQAADSTVVLSGTFAAANNFHTGQDLTAALTGTSGATGTAEYRAASTGENRFELSASGLTANASDDVQVDGTSVGQLITDANGQGELELSGLTATITAGSVLTVLDDQGTTVLQGTFAVDSSHSGCGPHGGTVLQGTFAVDSSHSGCGPHGGDVSSVSELSAALNGASGTSGFAEFRSSLTLGENRLELFATGLTANAMFDVQVDGASVGRLSTDANGRGELELSNVSVTVAASSALSVLDDQGTTVLQGTFSVGGGCHGPALADAVFANYRPAQSSFVPSGRHPGLPL